MERGPSILDLGDIGFLSKETNEERDLASDSTGKEIDLAPVWGDDGFPRLTDDMRRAKNKKEGKR